MQEALTEATGIRTVVAPIENPKAPLAEPLRVTFINPDYPGGLGAFVGSDTRMNLGGHHDPELDRLLETNASEQAIVARLSESPPFVPLGVMRLWLLTSHRFNVTLDPTDVHGALHIHPVQEGHD